MKKNNKILKILLLAFACLTILSACELNHFEQSGKPRTIQNSEDIVIEDLLSTRVLTIDGDKLTVDDIRLMLSRGEQVYQNIRIYDDTGIANTYQIPIPADELEYLITFR